VNWFRTDASGRFVWPGFGENARVLKWILQRMEQKAGAEEHVFGYSPRYQDIDWSGLGFSEQQFAQISAVDLAAWKDEFKLHDVLFETLALRMPETLKAIKVQLSSQVEEKLAA
jgi:phosphoenolpyruvate carboxykinase (GTP)